MIFEIIMQFKNFCFCDDRNLFGYVITNVYVMRV